MNFEILPNEMLIECFQYLNATDIFYSFDCLNYRFRKLIRSIPLHLNTEHIKHSSLVQFCNTMLSNTHIRDQIHSLQLFNNGRYDQISLFLSHLALDQFPHLRSLCLIGLSSYNVLQLIGVLPLLSNLRRFRFTVEENGVDEILASLTSSYVQTLVVPTLELNLELIDQFTSLSNLTISRCSISELCQFFKYSPRLQYLNVDTIEPKYDISRIDQLRLFNEHAVNLKRLIINHFQFSFDLLEILLNKTPNLKLLIIYVKNRIDMIDACRWKHLITASLPVLHIFKFKFRVGLLAPDDYFLDEFQQFQSDFWHKEHNWYTEWILNKNEAIIYTIPYMSNNYLLMPYTKRYCNASVKNSNIYDNITDLTLFIEAMTDTCDLHFTNVTSLRLDNDRIDENHAYPFLKNKHIRSLNTIVNICHLTHLDISSKCRMKSPLVILHLLQEMPNVSSLKISKDILFFLISNNELCNYFNKTIKKLDVTDSNMYSSLKANEIVKLTQVFSNIEYFRCNDGMRDNLQLILDELKKLPHVKVFSYRTPYFQCRNRWLKYHAAELDTLYSFTIECERVHYGYGDFKCYTNDDEEDFDCPPFDYQDSDDKDYR